MKPDFDISKCKDVAFARNLIRQMDDGYGRHNSNMAFRDYTGNRGVTIVHIRETSGPRVVGRFADGCICSRESCRVGDAFRFDVQPVEGRYLRFIPPFPIRKFCQDGPSLMEYVEHEAWTFEKVAVEMTPDEGRTWNTEYFWKRIE